MAHRLFLPWFWFFCALLSLSKNPHATDGRTDVRTSKTRNAACLNGRTMIGF